MKKAAWICTLAILLFAFAGAALAAEAPALAALPHGTYASVTGTIVGAAYDPWIVMVEDAGGSTTGFMITPETVFLDGVQLDEGAQVQMFYSLSGFAPAIYPPQYFTAVAAPLLSDALVFVGQFDEDLVSLDGQLKLTNVDEAEMITEGGVPFQGDLPGRTLVVIYGVSTRSIPAQTAPSHIIALPAADEAIVLEPVIVIEGEFIGQNGHMDAFGIFMVPLVPALEALGYETIAEDPADVFQFGDGIRLQVDVDEYQHPGEPPVSLGIAPRRIEGVVHVPLHFFRDFLGMNNAYYFEGMIVIDNQEAMV